MYYISHPFTGCDEKKNRKSCRNISSELSELYPNYLFINPLDTFRHLEKTNLTYNKILEQCIDLLAKCDGIIMCKGWANSFGCSKEAEYAIQKGIEIYYCVDDFKKRDKE